MIKSKYKKINFKDISKGFILAFITAFVATTVKLTDVLVNVGTFDLSWQVLKPGLISAAIAGGSYLIKNVFTNSKDQFAKPEPDSPNIKASPFN